MIEPIPQSEALKKDVSGRSIPREKERNESMMEAIEGNKPMISDASDRNLQRESSMRQSMVEPIGKSSALREDISGKSLPREEERHESMIEPITNEAIKKDASDKNLERQSELRQSMIEPIQNEPLSKDLSDKSLPKNIEMQEQMIEPVKGNSALQKKVSQKSLQKEVRDSIIEPIIQNQPLHQEVTEPTLEAQRQESLVEPLINNSPEFGRPSSNPTQQLYESQLEPIPKPQEQVFEKVTPSVTKSRQMNSSQMEPIPKHRPIYKDVSRSTFKEEQIEQMMQVEPVFEKLTPQDQSKEDIEIHPTEVPLRSDLSKRPIPEPEPEEEDLAFREEAQEQPVPMQVLSQQPIAKKIKKILYSDKSESSLDERMEDTPSNYNIPNGRLDGRSLGLKAIMLQEKKRGRKGPDVVKQPIQNDNLGKTLQPVSSGKLSSSKKSNLEATHQYFSPMRGTIQGPSQPSLLKNNGPDKVNNLFQDHSEVQIMTMNQPPQNSVFSRQGRVDSKGRQFQRRRIAPPSQEGDTGGHNSSLLNRKRAEALDLANQITHEYQPTFGAQDNDEDPDDNIYFMMDDNSKQTLPGGGTGTGMINGQKKKNTLPKGISKKQFKEEGSGNEAPNNNSPPPMMRNAPIDGINPYSIKTTLPDVGNKLPKLSFKQK